MSRHELVETIRSVPFAFSPELADALIAKIRELDGCYGKAIEDQAPIFVLKASDPIAPVLVENWALVAGKYGHSTEKVEEARQLARRMREWAANRDAALLKEAR